MTGIEHYIYVHLHHGPCHDPGFVSSLVYGID